MSRAHTHTQKKMNCLELIRKDGEKGLLYIQVSSVFLDVEFASKRLACCWRTSSTTEAKENVKAGSVAIFWLQEIHKKKHQADGGARLGLKCKDS